MEENPVVHIDACASGTAPRLSPGQCAVPIDIPAVPLLTDNAAALPLADAAAFPPLVAVNTQAALVADGLDASRPEGSA